MSQQEDMGPLVLFTVTNISVFLSSKWTKLAIKVIIIIICSFGLRRSWVAPNWSWCRHERSPLFKSWFTPLHLQKRQSTASWRWTRTSGYDVWERNLSQLRRTHAALYVHICTYVTLTAAWCKQSQHFLIHHCFFPVSLFLLVFKNNTPPLGCFPEGKGGTRVLSLREKAFDTVDSESIVEFICTPHCSGKLQNTNKLKYKYIKNPVTWKCSSQWEV